jgi:hypothetical protein
MIKLRLALAVTFLLSAAGHSSAYGIGGTPYTFTGSVTSATASCPYAAKTALAGYTLVQKNYAYLPPTYQPTLAGFGGPQMIFSPGGTADKITMKIGSLPLHSGAISGSETIIVLPSLTPIKGTYKGTFSLSPSGAFSLSYTSKFTNKGVLCTTTYDLSFTVGIPAKFLNLL